MRTVLWDLDGTLADTESLHFQAWAQTLAAYAVPYDYDAFVAGFGRNNRAILSELFQVEPEAPLVEEVAQRKERNYRALLGQTDLLPLPGVAEWLAHFQQARTRQLISSSGPMANIAATIAQLGVGDYFVALMSGATLARGKPDPLLFHLSAAAAGVAPADCLVVEDSIHGIAAARHAGMTSVAVGKLAGSTALAEVLATVPGPACVAVPSLEHLPLASLDELWEGAG